MKCRKCRFFIKDWCNIVCDSPVPDMERDCQYYIHQTNGGKIRAMTDEELAKYLYRMVHDCMMGVFPGWHFTPEKDDELIQSWLNWLQEECDDA